MPQRNSTPLGAPCWIDLFTADPEASKAFYGRLFGWTAVDAGEEYGGYITFAHDGVPVAGAMRNDGQSGVGDVWSVYLATADARATAEAAVAAGGQIMVPPLEVPLQGTMAVLTDPGGAAVGVWQPALHTGFGVLAEPGAPAWFELHTRDYDAAVRFYREVFDWDTSVVGDTPDFRYTTLGEGDAALAGVMDAAGDLPPGVPAHWTVYFAVEDTDAALSEVVGLGGAIVEPAVDTPYGRLAAASDPTGARFKLTARP